MNRVGLIGVLLAALLAVGAGGYYVGDQAGYGAGQSSGYSTGYVHGVDVATQDGLLPAGTFVELTPGAFISWDELNPPGIGNYSVSLCFAFQVELPNASRAGPNYTVEMTLLRGLSSPASTGWVTGWQNVGNDHCLSLGYDSASTSSLTAELIANPTNPGPLAVFTNSEVGAGFQPI